MCEYWMRHGSLCLITSGNFFKNKAKPGFDEFVKGQFKHSC